jgi:hypothetical protein
MRNRVGGVDSLAVIAAVIPLFRRCYLAVNPAVLRACNLQKSSILQSDNEWVIVFSREEQRNARARIWQRT